MLRYGFYFTQLSFSRFVPKRSLVQFKPYTREQRSLKARQKMEVMKAKVLASSQPKKPKPMSIIVEQLSNTLEPDTNKLDEHYLRSSEDAENILGEDLEWLEQQEKASLLSVDWEEMKSQKKNSSFVKQIEAYLTDSDPSLPVSNYPCAGCGAHLHAQDPDRPGFVPKSHLEEALEDKSVLSQTVCSRCHLLSSFVQSKESHVTSYSDYVSILSDVRGRNATVVVVVDMLDLPGSIVPNLHEITQGAKYVIVGNKVDLLPRDSGDYMKRWTDCLRSYCNQMGISDDLIYNISLVSGKSNFGIENFIDKMLSRTIYTKNPVYIVGCTNVGKSTIFNKLLMSDYCKALARESFHRATISPWPGTTMNLLKFPIVSISAQKLNRRLQSRAEIREQEKLKSGLQSKVNLLPTYYQKLKGSIAITFETPKLEEGEHQKVKELTTYSYNDETNEIVSSDYEKSKMLAFYNKVKEIDEREFSQNSWCFDTPGYLNENQIINYLTMDELRLLSNSSRVWIPRTFVLKPGLSLFISGLARIDVLQCTGSLYLTTHTVLPVHIVDTSQADLYPLEMAPHLRLPLPFDAPPERPRSLEPLAPPPGDVFTVHGKGFEESVADIVLSSLGWASVACEGTSTLQGLTPGGRGCALRTPPLLPFSVARRGPKIKYTREFAIRTAPVPQSNRPF